MSRSPRPSRRAVAVAAAALLAGGGAAALAQAPGRTPRVHSVTYPASPIQLQQLPLTFPVERYDPGRSKTADDPG
jgi:hypothetical protein